MADAPVTTAPGARYRSTGTSAQALGLLLLGLSALTFLLAGQLIGGVETEDIGFWAVLTAGPLIAALLSARFGAWSKVLGILVALGFMGGAFWIFFGVFYPQSPVEFVPGLMVPMGFLLALIGGIVALVKARDRKPAVGSGERGLRNIVVGIIVIGAAVSIVLGVLNREAVTAEEAEGATEIHMTDFEFDPGDATVAAGEVTVVLRNYDAFVHSFTNEDLDVDEFVIGQNDALLTFEAEAGTYEVYCMPHSDTSDGLDPENDMMMTLTVE